jgi:probable phosphoglycerate mutase
MDIYIVRHGETQWNKEEVFRGRRDVPLNEAGKGQAKQAAAYFAGMPVARIVSSPLARAVETAEAIGLATHVSVETAEEFIDINFGVWEGLPLREVKERFPADFAIWRTSPEKLRIEGGETLGEARQRASDGLARLAGLDGAVVITTHRVICKVLVLHLLNMGNEHFWDMLYDPGSITLLEGKAGRFTLVFSNDACRRREDGRPAKQYRDF